MDSYELIQALRRRAKHARVKGDIWAASNYQRAAFALAREIGDGDLALVCIIEAQEFRTITKEDMLAACRTFGYSEDDIREQARKILEPAVSVVKGPEFEDAGCTWREIHQITAFTDEDKVFLRTMKIKTDACHGEVDNEDGR